jgi:hypothetical protein
MDNTQKRVVRHKKGYRVWVHGVVFWHRSLKGAERRVEAALAYCNDIQIIDVQSGCRVWY